MLAPAGTLEGKGDQDDLCMRQGAVRLRIRGKGLKDESYGPRAPRRAGCGVSDAFLGQGRE